MAILSPMLHSESKSDVLLSLDLLTQMSETKDIASDVKEYVENQKSFALDHFEILQQFGRYPHRNKVLGRESSAEELEYL